jgi:hypothetical protein
MAAVGTELRAEIQRLRAALDRERSGELALAAALTALRDSHVDLQTVLDRIAALAVDIMQSENATFYR